jgi:hypothetical protein
MFMSNILKFDPKAIHERKRLNDKAELAKDDASQKAKKASRMAWLIFAGTAIVVAILKTAFHLGLLQ